MKRKSNFELLRLVAIFVVVLSHSFLYSGNKLDFNIASPNFVISNIFMLGCVANLCFMILSGYFMSEKKIKLRKILNLVGLIYFYSISLLLIRLIFNHNELSFQEILASLLPFPFGNWFCVGYAILYLSIPLLNRIIKHLNKKKTIILLAISYFLIILVPRVLNMNFLTDYAMFFWCFFLGYYFKKYIPKERRITFNHFGIFLFAYVFLNIVIYSISAQLGKVSTGASILRALTTNGSPAVIILASTLFMMFRNLDIKQNKRINRLSMSTLGVYLIHENIFAREFIWGGIPPTNIQNLNTPLYIIAGIIKTAIVLIVCLIIDQIRIKIMEVLCKKKSQ